MSSLIEIQDERDLYLKLFLTIFTQVPPFLLLFFMGNYDSLTWVPAAVVWFMYILAVVVALKRQKDDVDRLQRQTTDYPFHGEGCTVHDCANRFLGCDSTRLASWEEPSYAEQYDKATIRLNCAAGYLRSMRLGDFVSSA